ncbi:TIGR02300 family protein [Anianabacter salinae]|uniref:TIGR02300 family protein n=1 Tax=Anianabacter salinae TaxID=2851023 RepID=UPI00225E49F5|nr:TIGR02300 family protein [Anianabacter salinae]MBV0913037.1 TIGR02300 family protein [Anianabacter salinae]
MPKEEWGKKRICPTTGKRFYDLNKTPIVSPYTGEVVEIDSNTRSRVALPEKKAKPAKVEEEVVDDDAVLDDDDNEVEIDDDLLDDDDDEDNVSLDDIADVAKDDDDS